ncbi:hypothetical protein [Pedobacter steynii]|uniref:Lipocalin-like domain-containing protein n=1 Tax=Pedobacter steynii TaxID=430522 RepID=A0A1D7QN99_9SPHI|nr:hypothetical protein [Pedobacter steynii]AOM80099.1 hypothetical protein BFS30_24810 [Pedobacter steynii]
MNKKSVFAIVAILSILSIFSFSCKKEDKVPTPKEPSFAEKFYKKWKLDTTIYVIGIDTETTPGEPGDYMEFKSNSKFTYHVDDTTVEGNFQIIGNNNGQVKLTFPSGYEFADILNQVYSITMITSEKLNLYYKGNNTETTFIMKQK